MLCLTGSLGYLDLLSLIASSLWPYQYPDLDLQGIGHSVSCRCYVIACFCPSYIQASDTDPYFEGGSPRAEKIKL